MLRAPATMLTHAAKRFSTNARASCVACASELHAERTTILSVIFWGRRSFLGVRTAGPLGDSLAERVGILGAFVQLQVLGVGFERGGEVVQLLAGFTEFHERLGGAGIPARGFQIALLGRAVVALLIVEIAG